MGIRILLISDIHGNYPALCAIGKAFLPASFDYIINCGDSLVYAPFPNETLDWLKRHKALSILGNTDKKVIKLLRGKTVKKPGKPEKRIMYTSTADSLRTDNKKYLFSLPKSRTLSVPLGVDVYKGKRHTIGIFHGSPARHHEFLFADTRAQRFRELARETPYSIVVTGHSHSPYHKTVESTHFINPGSVGRMFDGDPSAGCATVELTKNEVRVHHFRIGYPISDVVLKIKQLDLPEIYSTMYQTGRKLN